MTLADFSVQGLVCLVSGGTSGLGLVIAKELGAAGANLIVGGTSETKARDAQRELEAIGCEALGLTFDVRDRESASRAVEATAQRFGRLDALINAAGVNSIQPTLETSLEDWRRVVDINLTGAFLMSQLCAPMMRESGGGRIVNLASLGSYVAFPDMAAYCASKAGLISLTQSLANDWAEAGIRVNAVVPGVFITDMNQAWLEESDFGQRIISRTPARRFGELAEVAGAVIFLLSAASSFITGTALTVDGGFHGSAIGPSG